jgi:membrane protein YqaA with SNARE-associated domain
LLAFAAIAVATLTPTGESLVSLTQFCVVCGEFGAQDFLDNILLFVPLGLTLRLAGVPRWRAVAIALLTTVTVEALQYKIVTGRDSSVGDVLSNTLGGMLGVLLAERWRDLLAPSARRSRRLALAGVAGWLGVLAATAWALTPSVPDVAYRVQWLPEDPSLANYHGDVLAASLAGAPLPPGPLPAEARAALRAGAARLEARVTTGNERGDFAPIIRVRGADSSELAAIGERDCDLEFHVWMRVSAMRLRGPAVTAPRVFPCGGLPDRARGEPEGDTMVVAGERDGSLLRVTARGRGREASRTLALTPTLGWSFFFPWAYPFGGTHWPLSALWVGGLLLPAAYWAGRGRARWGPPLLLAAVALGLGALPPFTALATPAIGEWLGALLGGVAGWALGRGLAGGGPHVRALDERSATESSAAVRERRSVPAS